MALILNEEQQSLKDIAQDFLDKNAPISHFREIRDSDNKTGYSKELWKKIADLGWAGILVSEDYGGFNFGMMGMGGILEETGKNLTPSPSQPRALDPMASNMISYLNLLCSVP